MNILIVTKHLKNYAGSEIFTRDLAFVLRDRGHKVFVFAKELGFVSDEIAESGILVTNNIKDYKSEKFDVIHAQHSITTILARAFFPNVPIVFLAHGTISDFEKLPNIDLGISFYLGVSEEVASNFSKLKSIDADKIGIVRNFIDTEKFRPTKPVKDIPQKLMVLSNHYIPSVKITIEKACNELGIKVFHVGMPENSQENVAKFINEVDVVVTLGRGVLESMSCGRNVIIYDWNGGDGFVDEKNFFEFRKKNLSGRTKRKIFTFQEFKNEILKYDPSLGRKLREIIKEEHSTEKTVSLLEKIYSDAIKEFSANYEKSFITRIMVNKKIAHWYVLFIIFYNKILKILRLAGLRKF